MNHGTCDSQGLTALPKQTLDSPSASLLSFNLILSPILLFSPPCVCVFDDRILARFRAI